MATLHDGGTDNPGIVYVKGAVEAIMETMCFILERSRAAC